jgi:hypothetical protein
VRDPPDRAGRRGAEQERARPPGAGKATGSSTASLRKRVTAPAVIAMPRAAAPSE